MATVTTSTQAQAFSYPSESYLDRSSYNGRLYQLVRNSGGSLQIYYSTNNGGSWTASDNFFRANVQEYSGIFIDNDGWIHLAYRVYESGRDIIYYRRCGSAGWSQEVQVASATAAVSGAAYQGLSIVAMIFGHHTDAFIAVGTTSGANIGVTVMSLTMKWVNDWWSGGYYRYQVVNLIQGTNKWFMTGSGRISPGLDIRHNGDGHTSNVPEIWVSFGRTTINVVKIAYSNGRWIGPTTSTTIATATTAQNATPGRFDGSRFLVPVLNGDKVSVYERDVSNTVTQLRTSPVHTTGVVRYVAINYTSSTGDFRLYAVGTSTALLYFVDYVRATNTWGAWSATTKTVVNVNNFGTRRGSYGNARYDYYVQTGTSPYTLEHNGQTLVFAPNTPVLNAPVSGAAADVASPLAFEWTFSDIDPADNQSGYALSRQIGAGALAYWRASDGTWQASEVNNATSTKSVTIPIGWGADSDDPHTYRVKTWDNSSLPSSYSAGISVIPSAKINPVITYPTTAQTNILTDSFNRVSADLVGSLPTGLGANAWTGTAARWDVDGTKARWLTGSNMMRVNAGGTGDTATYWDNSIVSTLNTGSAYQFQWLAKSDAGTTNMLFIRLSVDSSGNNKVSIFKNVAGVGTELAFVSNALPQSASLTYNASLKVEGSVVTAILGPVALVAFLTQADMTAFNSFMYNGFSSTVAMSVDAMYVNSVVPQTITASDITISWTVASQKAFRVQLYEVSANVLVYDSGVITSTATSYRLPYTLLNNTSYRLALTTTNAEGLTSNIQTLTFNVDFVEPVAPTFSVTAVNAEALIRLSVLNPDPAGLEPLAENNAFYRRRVSDTSDGELIATIDASTSTNLLGNHNYSFEQSIGTAWASDNTGVSTVARTGVQFKLGAFSMEQTAVNGTGFAGIYHGPYNSVSATPGTSYTITAWVKGTAGRTFQVYLWWLNASETSNGFSAVGTVVASGLWQQVTLTAVAPASTAYVIPFVGKSVTANSIGEKSWVDDVRLSVTGAIAQPTIYDDFTVASRVDYEYRCLTTANNGTSVYTSWQS